MGVLHRRGSHRLDDRVEALADELLALFARLPDIEDTEDAAVVIEAPYGSAGRQERPGD